MIKLVSFGPTGLSLEVYQPISLVGHPQNPSRRKKGGGVSGIGGEGLDLNPFLNTQTIGMIILYQKVEVIFLFPIFWNKFWILISALLNWNFIK